MTPGGIVYMSPPLLGQLQGVGQAPCGCRYRIPVEILLEPCQLHLREELQRRRFFAVRRERPVGQDH